MKYIVTRTSQYDNPYCPNAQKEIVSRNGILEEAYTVEINSLEELHKLIDSVEYPIVLFTKVGWGYDLPKLEIYDDYRE